MEDATRPGFEIRLSSAKLWLASQRGDLHTAREAMRVLQSRAADPAAGRSDLLAIALMNFGVAELWATQLADARRHLEEALALARRIGRPYLEVGCLGQLALVAVFSGAQIAVGLQLSEDAVTIAEEHGWATNRIVAPALAASAGALAWLGRLDEAEHWLERMDRTRPASGELDVEPVLHYACGFVRLGQGRFQEALTDFRAAETARPMLAREHVLPAELRAWVAQAQLLMGDTEAARAALAAHDGQARQEPGMRLVAAALALKDGAPQEAARHVAPMLATAGPDGAQPVLNLRRATVHALLLDAAARDALGDAQTAEASIERALELAEQDGTILPFTLVPVRPLLECHPRHRTAHASLLTAILDVLDGVAPERPRAATPAPRGAQRSGAARPALPAQQPQGDRDRFRAVRLRQHGEDAPPAHLRQARRPQPQRGRHARPRARAPRTPGGRARVSSRRRRRLVQIPADERAGDVDDALHHRPGPAKTSSARPSRRRAGPPSRTRGRSSGRPRSAPPTTAG